MDIKKIIDETVEKLKADKTLLTRFQSEPVKVLEELVGMDLPDDQIEKIIDAIKAKINLDKLSDKLGGLGGLFGKK